MINACKPGSPLRRFGLAIFDLDGTLTRVDSVWQFLHRRLGTWDEAVYSNRAFAEGRISYSEWARRDAELWKGLPLQKLMDLATEIDYVDGAKETVDALSSKNIHVAIVSAGLSILADRARLELGIDTSIANDLEVKGGLLTGGVTVKVEPSAKLAVIEQIARRLDMPLSQIATIGDKGVDLPGGVGLRIAFNPRDEEARQNSEVIIEGSDLRAILPHVIR